MKKKTQSLNRREFTLAVSSLAAGVAAAEKASSDALGKVLPRRRLGKTEMMVTRYCPGGMHIEWMEEKDSARAIELCIENGVRFFDTAYMYGRGRSEELYGKYLTPKYREHVNIMSKTTGRDAKSTREQLEGGLRRMKIDCIDLYMIHAVNSVEDAQARLKGGVLDELRKAKAEGKVRHIGFSGHRTPTAHNWLLNEGFPDAEAVLLPINVADPSYDSFILNTVPLLLKKDAGILAMKTLGNAGLLGGTRGGTRGDAPGTGRAVIPEIISVRDAHRFSMSLPVAAIVSGSNDLSQLQQNLETARNFQPLGKSDREELIAKCAAHGKTGEMEFYKWPRMRTPRT
ncbi:aldo/keto reductase [Pontiella sulfatireligans]|uniref:General stress protein 69 n=1 Tax=Pontiella sulfatireligans TaxID=2750658 RepID=A0A6C2USW5_9BACT|nr:aldo/keto reductase [Pontiella sulfatireligans]VGO23422.1 General stress protein 69 [Pontiella sulfatireligans]